VVLAASIAIRSAKLIASLVACCGVSAPMIQYRPLAA